MPNDSFNNLLLKRQNEIVNTGIKIFSQKCYSETKTEEITKLCGISKGLLFHYFGCKKDYYIYCLTIALNRLVFTKELDSILNTNRNEKSREAFYTFLFSFMDKKFKQCVDFPNEMHFVNMASKELSSEVKTEKDMIFAKSFAEKNNTSKKIMFNAISCLNLHEPNSMKVVEAISLYINAIMNKYLLMYLDKPDDFFSQSETIKTEMKTFLDFMLDGVEIRRER